MIAYIQKRIFQIVKENATRQSLNALNNAHLMSWFSEMEEKTKEIF